MKRLFLPSGVLQKSNRVSILKLDFSILNAHCLISQETILTAVLKKNTTGAAAGRATRSTFDPSRLRLLLARCKPTSCFSHPSRSKSKKINQPR